VVSSELARFANRDDLAGDRCAGASDARVGGSHRVPPESGGGPAIDLTQTPLPGAKFQTFYGFAEHPKSGGTVTFYNAKGKSY
jgi:hypothetical protein